MSNQDYYNQQPAPSYEQRAQQPLPQQQGNPYGLDLENQKDPFYGEAPVPSQNYDEAFKVEKPGFNDWPFAVFFLAVVGGFAAVAGITINSLRQTWGFQGSSIYDSSNTFTMNTNTIILFAFVIAVAIVGSFLIILLARTKPKFFITTGLIANVVLGFGTAIYYFIAHYYSAAIVFMIFTLLTAWGYWSCRSRIPFSATILEITIDVMKKYPSTLITSIIGLLVSAGFSALFSVVIVSTYVKYEPNSSSPTCRDGGCSNSKLIGILVFVFFAGYYITEVIKNIIHVTISGVYGTWYYLSNSDQGEPLHPALGAFKRAMTNSFGSVCFGSLIVSLLQLVRALIQSLKQDAFNRGDFCAGCGFLILDAIIGVIDWAVRYFNRYAYCYIALYGKSYVRLARDTFDLLRFKGMDALINDCFINTSLQLYSLFIGYLTALLAYLYLKLTKPEYNSNGTYYAPVVAFSFLIAGQITRVSLTVIDSGIATFFVALAKDPEVFQMTNRQRFDDIFRNYPQVLEKLTSDH